ncbi:MAG: transcriptional regulator [Tepidisphaeraceae bacterium]
MGRERQPASDDSPGGAFAFEGLARVIHERARLSILASLAAHPEGLVFNDLKRLCDLTDGNLSRQIQVLDEEKLVETWKGTRNNRPQTLVRMTADGRARFNEYLSELERVIAAASTTDRTPERTPGRPATS